MFRAGLLAALALLVPATLAAGCGGDDERSGGAAVTVVATTTHAADLAREVGGARAEVIALLPPGADPHDHEVRPDDVKALARAQVVVRSGGEVDAWLADAVESAGADAPTLTLFDHVQTLERDGAVDPHWWQDPRNAVRAVDALRVALTRADPAGARGYARRARSAAKRLRALDAAVAACLADIPAARRKLVTTHDSLSYYAARYGLETVGAVIPALTTQAQPSAGDVAALTRLIRREGVRAIFAERAVDARVERAIADEAGATVGRPLWTDTLGPPESAAATYAGAIAANTRAIAQGLTGGAADCTLPA